MKIMKKKVLKSYEVVTNVHGVHTKGITIKEKVDGQAICISMLVKPK